MAQQQPQPEQPEKPSVTQRLLRPILRFYSSARIDMREDYAKVRKFQQRMVRPFRRLIKAVDHQVPSEHGDHDIPVRVFRPAKQTRDEVLVFFHGGGWVIGDVDTYTPTCARMADLTGAVVVSVDYRLAPEHPFPAGLHDCYQIAHSLLKNPRPAGVKDPKKIVLIGDSAGANLAAVVSLKLREAGHKVPTRQILLYPLTHWDHNPETTPFASVREHGSDYRLTNTEVDAFMDLYAPDEATRKDWRVSPLVADNLANQPATLILTAEFDLLRDEAERYAEALANAGNTVAVHRIADALHGFIMLPRLATSIREAYDLINAFLDNPQSNVVENQDGV